MVCQILSGDGRYYGLGQYKTLWRDEPEALEPIRPLPPKEIERINKAEEIMAARSRNVRALVRVNEKLGQARYTSFYTPKAANHAIRKLEARKKTLLKQKRIIEARAVALGFRPARKPFSVRDSR